MTVLSLCALAAGLLGPGPGDVGPSPANDEVQLPGRVAGNEPPVNSGFLQSLEREDVNGRLWVGRPIIGGIDGTLRDRRQDGAARYGAYGEGDGTIVVSIRGLFPFESQRLAEVRPFERVGDPIDPDYPPVTNPFNRAQAKLAVRLEAARQQWLKDNNYVGGVRTFVNDAALLAPAEQKTGSAGGLPEPRGVIELAPDVPRFKSRMRVDAAPRHTSPTTVSRRSAGVTKVLPKDAPKEAAAEPAKDDAAAEKAKG